jgi:hypothetical protein
MGWGTYALCNSRILFACRLSVLSVLAGTLLFLMSKANAKSNGEMRRYLQTLSRQACVCPTRI